MVSYEMVSVFDPKTTAEAGIVDGIENILKKHGADNVSKEDWGVKKLAYEIRKKTDGHYFLFNFDIDNDKIVDMEKELNIQEPLIRHLIVKLEETEKKED